MEVSEEMNEVDVRMYCEDIDLIPQYESECAAGFDLRANIPAGESITIMPQLVTKDTSMPGFLKKVFSFGKTGEKTEVAIVKNWALIPTGVRTEIPVGYEIQVRPRSGLALKNGIGIMNAPGTIDSRIL